jgi:hypothetical protein
LLRSNAIGLCARCAHAKKIVSAKGSTFWLCGSPMVSSGALSKYPPLPVYQCPGFHAASEPPPADPLSDR